jgi:hypothetical protein
VALLLEQSLEVQRIILALPQARKIIKADRVNTEIGAEGSSIGRGEWNESNVQEVWQFLTSCIELCEPELKSVEKYLSPDNL